MITVKVKELSLIGSGKPLNVDDGLINIKRRTFNSFTHQHSKIIERDHTHRFCKNHPDYNNVITLTAVDGGVPLLEKTDFCCEDFKGKIGITIV